MRNVASYSTLTYSVIDMLTYERANELFHYDRSSGKLIRKVTTDYKAVQGTEAGTYSGGYKLVCIDKVKYKAHRVCMLLAYGYFPKGMQVDHINHNRSDNRLSNMRFVTDRENAKNHSMNKNNISGVTGVHFDKSRGKFMSYIKVNYKRIHLGRFDSIEEAIAVRQQAEKDFDFHPNHGQ